MIKKKPTWFYVISKRVWKIIGQLTNEFYFYFHFLSIFYCKMNYLATVAQYVVLHCQIDEQANKQSLIINCGLLIECRSSAKLICE